MVRRRKNRSKGGKKYAVKDPYFRRAKNDGYRARSAYKLKEILAKFKLVKKGDRVLDLGAAPGSFLQVLVRYVGPQGSVTGVDLKEIEPIPGVETVVGDIFTYKPNGQFDVITSDLAPNTTGIKFIDNDDSVELNLAALGIVKKHLKPEGHAVFKIFQCNELKKFLVAAERAFRKVLIIKPDAVRASSSEVYVVCVGRGSV